MSDDHCDSADILVQKIVGQTEPQIRAEWKEKVYFREEKLSFFSSFWEKVGLGESSREIYSRGRWESNPTLNYSK